MSSRGARIKAEDWTTPDGLLLIRGWARDGYTDKQIAANIGIGERTFTDWKKREPAIVAALKKGRRPVIEEVEDALYKGATGYDVEEVTEEIVDDGETKKKHIRRVKRHIPPNPALTIFALKNLKKRKFKDKPIDDDAPQGESEVSRKVDELIESVKRGSGQPDNGGAVAPD